MSATWDEVAAALGKDARQIHRWRKLPDAPREADVAAWLRWKETRDGLASAERGAIESVSPDADLPGECSYDAAVKAGKLTYAIAKMREQTIGERLANEAKAVEVAKAKGALVTREDAAAAAAKLRDETERRYDQAIAAALSALAAEQPASMPAELRASILALVTAHLDPE